MLILTLKRICGWLEERLKKNERNLWLPARKIKRLKNLVDKKENVTLETTSFGYKQELGKSKTGLICKKKHPEKNPRSFCIANPPVYLTSAC